MPTPPPRRLPAYDPLWSDGCSLAPFLPENVRARFQDWVLEFVAGDLELAREMRYICEAHDEAYYYGGGQALRVEADNAMRAKMKQIGAPFWFRQAAYRAIRTFGGPKWRTSGVSWAYGGSFFQYGVRALIHREITRSEPAQRPKAPLYGHDLWPFNEERCDCPDGTMVLETFDHQSQPEGMVCQGCSQWYTKRDIT